MWQKWSSDEDHFQNFKDEVKTICTTRLLCNNLQLRSYLFRQINILPEPALEVYFIDELPYFCLKMKYFIAQLFYFLLDVIENMFPPEFVDKL